MKIRIGTQGLAQPKVISVDLTEPDTEDARAPVAPPATEGDTDKKIPRKRRIR